MTADKQTPVVTRPESHADVNGRPTDPAPEAGSQSPFDRRLSAREASIAVIGIGYVGLPLALAYAQRGFRVMGLDVDHRKTDALNAGQSYVDDVSSHDLAREVDAGRLSATQDDLMLQSADVVFICVPTPCTKNKEPDTTQIRAAAESIARNQHTEQLVVLRSTSYPGTTEELVRPILEAAGLRVGKDVFLAFVPERVDPGRKDYTIQNTPVLVGGCDPESTRRACLVLSELAQQVIPISTPAAAEMAKLLENVFRNVNIALVNQLAMLCDRMGLDIWEITQAAATKPFGFLPFQPGPGVGGHCIPVDPYYLAWKAREFDFHMDFVELAARVNEDMPYFAAGKILQSVTTDQHPATPRILVIGVTFKGNVSDYRDSPALKIMELLRKKGAAVTYHDPYVPTLSINGSVMDNTPLNPQALAEADCVVIAANHASLDYASIVRHARKIFDTRNATARVTEGREKIIRL